MQQSSLLPVHKERLKVYGIESIVPGEIMLLRYDEGEIVCQEGIPLQNLLLVVSGKSKVVMNGHNGRDLLLNYYVSEGIIGEVELMVDDYHASTTMVAMTPFICIALPFCIWAERLKVNTVFMNKIGQALAKKLLRTSEQGVMTSLCGGKERLYQHILKVSPGGLWHEKLTNVASELGISYRHMLRLVKVLCDEGAIEKVKKGYKVNS